MPKYFWEWYESKGYIEIISIEECFKNKAFLIGCCIEYLTEKGQRITKLSDFNNIEVYMKIKNIFYPINLFNDTTHSTFLNRLALMQNNTYNFPKGSICYGTEIVEFTNYFDFDLTTPTDYKTLDEWKEHYATSREDNKPTFNTYQVGTKNDLTVTTVTIGNNPKIREAIVNYQNIYYVGSLETMPTSDMQALSKNNCIVYNDIAKNYMISEIKKYYK